MKELSNEFDSDVVTEDIIDVKEPNLYNVILYNDDYTTMDFVVFVLELLGSTFF